MAFFRLARHQETRGDREGTVALGLIEADSLDHATLILREAGLTGVPGVSWHLSGIAPGGYASIEDSNSRADRWNRLARPRTPEATDLRLIPREELRLLA